MRKVKQIGIKNRNYYFYNDISNIEESDSNLLKIEKTSYEDINIYYIWYITNKIVDDCENIKSKNPLYLKIRKVDGDIECNSIREKYGSKCLGFDSTDKKKVLKKYIDLRDGVKNETETMNDSKKGEYDKILWKLNLMQMIIYHWINH